MRRIKYNRKNDECYITREEEQRLRSKVRLNKTQKDRLQRFGRNSQDRYETLMEQQAAKAQIDYLNRQLILYGESGNMFHTRNELLHQLQDAYETAWPVTSNRGDE